MTSPQSILRSQEGFRRLIRNSVLIKRLVIIVQEQLNIHRVLKNEMQIF
jgi:hypothetical protein